MSSAIAIGIASGAATQSAINATQQAELHKMICEQVLKTYEPKTATTQEMKGYADCVMVIYPGDGNGLLPSDIILLKCALVIALISGAFGSYFNKDDGFIGVFLGFVVFSAFSAGVMLLLTLIFMSVMWLFV